MWNKRWNGITFKFHTVQPSTFNLYYLTLNKYLAPNIWFIIFETTNMSLKYFKYRVTKWKSSC